MARYNRKHIEKCDYCGIDEHYAKGLCHACYERARRNGTPEYKYTDEYKEQAEQRREKKQKEYSKKYYREHKEKCRKYNKEYWEKNKDILKKRKAEWYQKNKGRRKK